MLYIEIFNLITFNFLFYFFMKKIYFLYQVHKHISGKDNEKIHEGDIIFMWSVIFAIDLGFFARILDEITLVLK